MVIPIFVSLNSRLKGTVRHYWPELMLLFAFFAAALTFAINILSVSYIEVLDQTLANVYHYATGHGKTSPSGFPQLINAAKTLSPWGYLFLLSLPILVLGRYPHKKLILSLVVVALGTTVSLAGYHVFLSRNYIMNLVLVIICLSAMVHWLLKLIERSAAAIVCNFLSLTVFAFCVASTAAPRNPQLLVRHIDACGGELGVIGDVKPIFDSGQRIPSIPDEFDLREIKEPLRLKLAKYGCVYIKRDGNDKQYSNYLLLEQFEMVYRDGNSFLYRRRM